MSAYSICLLPGDGIGPEVTDAARVCLDAVAASHGLRLSYESHDFGGAAIDAHGEPLPEATLNAAKAADAVFLGAVGGPKWDEVPQRPEAGLLGIRKALGLYANIRPVKLRKGLEDLSPLRPERVAGADMVIVRELTGGLYFGEKELGHDKAFDGCAYTTGEIERITKIAFEIAARRSGRVTSVDKANVLATSKLWRSTVTRLAGGREDIALDHVLVDAMAMAIITHPARFDVILTENLFGDILSDEASVLAGSIGLLGSASLGGEGPGLFEPIHGSAPDIAGTGKANPGGAIASAAMLLRDGLGQGEAGDALDAALDQALASGIRTADLGGTTDTKTFTQAVLAAL